MELDTSISEATSETNRNLSKLYQNWKPTSVSAEFADELSGISDKSQNEHMASVIAHEDEWQIHDKGRAAAVAVIRASKLEHRNPVEFQNYISIRAVRYEDFEFH